MKTYKSLINNRKGFTLLEIIIVIIIIGVLASLAMPRFFRTVEYSKGQEALTALGVLRQAAQRCYLFNNTYMDCPLGNLDVDDPGSLTGAHFSYVVTPATATTFTITATRNTLENGDGSSTIAINQDGVKTGGGIFAGVR